MFAGLNVWHWIVFVYSFLRKAISLISSSSQLCIVLCVGLRPKWNDSVSPLSKTVGLGITLWGFKLMQYT